MKSLWIYVLAASAAWGQSVYSGTASSRGTAVLAAESTQSSFFVAPAAMGGSDSNDCSLDHPCLTPQHVTALAKPGSTVTFRGGEYFLGAPWTFSSANSGTSDTARIIYQAFAGEAPVISGGKQVSGTWATDASIYCGTGCTAYFIDLNASQFSNFETLFYNGSRRPRIRTTSASSYLYNANQVIQDQIGAACVSATTLSQANTACGCPSGGLDYDGDGSAENCALSQAANTPGWMCNAPGATYACFNKFLFTGTDVPSAPHGLGLGDVQILDFEKWTVSRMRLQSAAAGIATLTGPTAATTNQGFLAGHRFLVENVSPKDLGAVLTAGQWYLDRCPGCAYNVTTPASSWRLHYLASPGENPNNDKVIVPQAAKVIDANGLKYVTFSGLTFSHDNYSVGQYGLGEQQGMPRVSAALNFVNSSNITIDSSVVSHTQGWGLQFVTAGAGGSSGNQFTNSLAYDLGAGGVRVGMPPSASDTDADVPQNVTVENNEISYVGQYDPSGIGPAVWIGNAHHVTVTHNDIHHTYSGGIENGFKLGRVQTASSTSYTHDNWITYNHLYDLGLGVTNDFGGIYSATSLSPNCPAQGSPQLTPVNTYCNHLVGNVIHDVVHDTSSAPGDGYNGIGIYNDQGTSHNEARNNIVYRTSDSCVFNNLSDRTSDTYDQWNLFENNVFAACGSSKSAVHVVLKRGGHNPHSFTFRQNVVAWAQGAYPQQKPGNWDCFDDLQAPTACTNRFAFDHNAYWYGIGQTPTFVTCAGAGCGSPGTCGTNPGYNCFNGVSAWNAGTKQEDLLEWFLTPDPTRKTNHLNGSGVNTYSYLDADGQKFWLIKNSAGNPWDINLYDDSKIYLWITENGDEVGGWGNPRAWKRALTPRPIAPRHFTPGTTVTYTTTGPAGQSNPGARTMNCETDGEANVYLGDVQGVTTGPVTMAWGNDVGTKPTITVNYYYSGSNGSYHSRERFFLVKGWGWVQWDLASCAGTCTPGISIYTVSQTSTKTTLAAGGSPTPNWPCGTSYPWWVGGSPGVGGNASKASGSVSVGEDEGSLDAVNPLFRNPAAGDYTPTADLSSISFDPVDVLQAGRRTHNSEAPINLKDSFPITPLLPSDFSNDGGAPVAHLSSSTLVFAGQMVGSTSMAQTVTVSNVGVATLAINSVAVTGDFGQTNDCGSMLDVGESCSVNVTFTPTAVGTRSGELSISDNAGGSPQQVTLSGTGTTQAEDFANPYCGPGDTPNFGSSDGPAAMPTSCIYTAMGGSPSPGVTSIAVDSADFTAKLAAANCGDTIVLNAGTTYAGKFTLLNKGCDAGHWITIRTSAIADPNFPVESVRATPCEIGQASVANYPSYACPNPGVRMPTIMTNQVNTPAIEASSAGATYYRLIGLNVTKAAGSSSISNKLIQLCANGTCNTGSDHIIIDRCLLHGQPWTGITNDDLQGGVGTINSTYVAVIDSWLYDTYCQSNCSDSNAVSGGTGIAPEGPIKLVNNLLASSGETFLWGGGGATTVPHDLEIRRNHSFKPLSWMLSSGGSGTHVINKNGGECKNCQRVLFEGNVFENNWTGWQGDQMGYGLLLTPKNQEVYQTLTVDIAGTTATRVSGGYFYANMVGQNFRITGGVDNNQMILITGVGPAGCTNNCTTATLANAPGHGDQSGVSARGCNPGPCPNCKVTDVTVRFNEFRNLTRGMQIASVSTQCGTVSSGMSNVSLHDNLMHGLDNRMSNASSPAGIAVGFDINDGQPVISNIAVAHNTVAIASAPPNSYSGFGFELVQSQSCSNLATGDYLANMTYRDNLAPAAMFPMCGSGAIFAGGVLDGLNYHGCPNHDGLNCTWTWAKNVMGTGLWTSQIAKTPYPSGTCGTGGETCLPSGAAFTSIFNNYNNGYQGDYGVQASSPYHNASSDGKDIGADISTLVSLTQGVRSATAHPALTITTSVLSSGTTGTAYTQTLAASAGASPFKYWTVSSGSLPPGLTMSLAGVITGTPTAPGTYVFTAQVLDGARQADTQGFTITIN